MKFTLYSFYIFTILVAVNSLCVFFDNLPATFPASVPSVGFEALAINELGTRIELVSLGWKKVNHISVLMNSWAPHFEWVNYSCEGYQQNITLSIYDTSLISLYRTTQQFLIPWRPGPNTNCSNPSSWMDIYGNCWNGLAFEITFNTSDSNLFPSDLIYSIIFNTEHYGPSPTGISGPYNSLNIGLSTSIPTIGSFWDTNTIYLNSTNSGSYGDLGPVNVFRLCNGLNPYQLSSSLTCDC
jgi:hypothetical protein